MNKKITTSIVSLIIVALLVAGGVYYYQKNYAPPKDLVTKKDPGLTDEEKQSSAKIISDDQAKLASASDEDKYRLYLQIAAENFRLGNFQEALDADLQAAKLFPNNSVPWGEAANVAFSMNNFRDAKKYIDKALQLNPTSQNFKDLLQKIEEKIKTA